MEPDKTISSTNANDLVKLQDAVRQMILDGVSKEDIDSVLAAKGETPESMRAIGQFGAEKIAEVRANSRAMEEERNSLANRAKRAGQTALEGLRGSEDTVFSLAEEVAHDYSGGLYGEKYFSEGYHRRKEAEEKAAADIGKWALGLEKGVRGLAGLYGQMLNPIYKIPGLAGYLIAPAAYEATSEWARGGDKKDVLKGAGRGLMYGGMAYGVSKLADLLLKGTSLASGISPKEQSDIKDAGKRGSKAFREGMTATDAQYMEKVHNKISNIDKAAREAIKTGKDKIGDIPANNKELFTDLKDVANKYVKDGAFQGSARMQDVLDDAQKYVRNYEKIKKPTVMDLDRLKRNINSINIKGDAEAKLIRTELANVVKGAADTATGGQYSAVMAPYEKVANALADVEKVAKDNKDFSRATANILRKARSDFGRETIKNVLGDEVYDMTLGRLASDLYTRWGLGTALTATIYGHPLVGLGVAGVTSPRISGALSYAMGRYLPTLQESIVPMTKVSKTLGEIIGPHLK